MVELEHEQQWWEGRQGMKAVPYIRGDRQASRGKGGGSSVRHPSRPLAALATTVFFGCSFSGLWTLDSILHRILGRLYGLWFVLYWLVVRS